MEEIWTTLIRTFTYMGKNPITLTQYIDDKVNGFLIHQIGGDVYSEVIDIKTSTSAVRDGESNGETRFAYTVTIIYKVRA